MTDFEKYIQRYLDLIPSEDWLNEMENTIKETVDIFNKIDEEKGNYAYSDGKWTLKILLQHLTETEKIFNYRALRFSKNDSQNLLGFDEENYAKENNTRELTVQHLLEEFKCVRKMSILFFKGLTPLVLERKGVANDNEISVETIGKLIVGHHIHHLNIIKERYL